MGFGNLNFSFPAKGVMLVFTMYGLMFMAVLKILAQTVLHRAGLKILAQTVLHRAGFGSWAPVEPGRRRFSVIRFETLLRNRRWVQTIWGGGAVAGDSQCCVCLCRFEDSEEVGELSCRHFFHKDCLQRWFNHRRLDTSCPLCRSVM